MICANCGDKKIRCDHCLLIEAREENARLLKQIERFRVALEQIRDWTYVDNAEGPELRAQNARNHGIAASALEGEKNES